MGHDVGMKFAHESEPIRRGAGAESPTLEIYSATGAEKTEGVPKGRLQL